MNPLPNRRGQSAVVFALCLVLLTLMVTMTLSFGTMAKEKMEIQQASDQAAYSQAVAIARTFNELAVYNRAQIGQMVSILGVQSALSFAAMWRAYVNRMMNGYFEIQTKVIAAQRSACAPLAPPPPPGGCTCADWGGARTELVEDRIWPLYKTGDGRPYGSGLWDGEYERLMSVWQGVDAPAGAQVKTLQGYASALYGAQTDAFDRVLVADSLDGSTLARALVDKAAAGRSEWAVVDEQVSLREVNAAVLRGGDNLHAVRAAMGSRGHPFVTRRLGGAVTLAAQMRSLIGTGEGAITEPPYRGSSYFGLTGYPSAHSNTVATSSQAYAWGDDHVEPLNLTFVYSGNGACSRSAPSVPTVYGFVKSTDMDEVTDQHDWEPKSASNAYNEMDPPTARHTTMRCRITLPAGGWVPCISVWVPFVDYRPTAVANKGDAFGQPKTFAAVKRDYSARAVADPWNLAFRFRFGSSSNGAVFALRGSKTQPQPGSSRLILADGTDISVQSTVSTGIAYYHRMNHWREPPNLFNPFWRAGLVHADVDAEGEADFKNQISQSAPWAADAFLELRAQGWAGIP